MEKALPEVALQSRPDQWCQLGRKQVGDRGEKTSQAEREGVEEMDRCEEEEIQGDVQ